MKYTIILLLSFILFSCNDETSDTRFTYRVVYEVSGTYTTINSIEYTDENSTTAGPIVPASLPWELEFTLDYDADSLFSPYLKVDADLASGQEITGTVYWEDYKTDFDRETLRSISKTYSGVTNHIFEVYGGSLPK